MLWQWLTCAAVLLSSPNDYSIVLVVKNGGRISVLVAREWATLPVV